MNILLLGDSFSADWTVKYPDQKGWPNLLADEFSVTNISQAGCSEYKIWLQLNSVNLADYTHIIMSHTSPYRLPIKQHPLHQDDALHKNCDLMYLDVKHTGKMPSVVDYFENYFDMDYAVFVHNLIIAKEIEYLKTCSARVMHTTNLDWAQLIELDNFYSFEKYFNKKYRGVMNHFNDLGNKLIFEEVKTWLGKKQ